MDDYREDWEGLLGAWRERTARAQAMGGEERVARQHARGRHTARERIAALCDPDSFCEYGALAGGQHPGGHEPVAADALVGGTARVNGNPVVLFAEDFTVQGGSIGHPNAAKRARLVRLALEQGLPLLMLLDGAGERASNQGERYPHAPGDLQLLADLQGQVPTVALVLGTSAGHGALAGMFADLVIMLEGSALFSAGPPLVKAAMGIDTTAAELGDARMHTRDSGVAHNLCASEADCFATARYFLSLLPPRRGAALPVVAQGKTTQPYRCEALASLIPPRVDLPYDMRAVLRELVDRHTLFELQPDYGRTLVTALARIGGRPCLLVANQPAVQAGAITRDAALKARHFIDMASRFGLPLVSLVDNPGVMPGPEAERSGVLRAAGEMFQAQRRYRGRKVVVVLRKAFGFGSSVMGMNPWDQQLVTLALPGISLGGVPALGGAAASGADDDEALAMQTRQNGAWLAADAMAVDRVVEPAALRNELIAALAT
jgi:acetyl-CoA carboxylase carboxyltransferase component